MKKINFEEISLKETNLYRTNYLFYNRVFRQNDITNVSQILDDNLMNKLLCKTTGKTKEQLNGFIALVKYKYLGEPLPIDPRILDIKPKAITAPKDGYDIKYGHLTKNKISYYYDIDFEKLGFCEQHIQLLHGIMRYKIETVKMVGDLKLIDIFKEVSSGIWYPYLMSQKCPIDFKEILTIYVDVYKGKKTQKYVKNNNNLAIKKEIITSPSITFTEKESTQQEKEKLNQLKEELLNLIFLRDNLDIQIEDIKEQIRKLSNDNKNGVVKR